MVRQSGRGPANLVRMLLKKRLRSGELNDFDINEVCEIMFLVWFQCEERAGEKTLFKGDAIGNKKIGKPKWREECKLCAKVWIGINQCRRRTWDTTDARHTHIIRVEVENNGHVTMNWAIKTCPKPPWASVNARSAPQILNNQLNESKFASTN